MSLPRRRLLLSAALLLVLPALAALGVHRWLQGDSVRARAHERLRGALEPRLGPVRLGPVWRVGWDGALELGPLEVPAASPDSPPVLRVERVTVRPRWRSLLSGRPEAREVHLHGVRVEAGPEAQALRALARRALSARPGGPRAGSDSEGPRALPEVRLGDVHLAFEREERVQWGPLSARLRVQRGASPRVEAQAELPGGGRARGHLERGEEGWAGRLHVEGASAGGLLSLASPPWRAEGGTLEAVLEVRPEAVRFDVAARGLTVEGEALASGPVGPLALGAEGRVRWSVRHHHVWLEELALTVGEREPLRVEARGEAHGGKQARWELQAELQPLTLARARQALPEALAPAEALTKLEGSLWGQLTVEGPVHTPAEWRVKTKLETAGLRKAGPRGPLAWVQGPFDYQPLTAEGRGPARRVGPGQPGYVGLEEVPRALVGAVLLSEDAGFLFHRGFDFEALREYLLAPRDGKVRGGSTLTQQLAKNLFLTRERTYARKVQEAWWTLGLEASASKERLLEIYLNVIEWGPGLYGLGEAAAHYFGKPASQLTVRESAFLATLIPSPVRYHVLCTRGALTEGWEQKLRVLLGKLHTYGYVTQEEYTQALGDTLSLGHREEAQPGP